MKLLRLLTIVLLATLGLQAQAQAPKVVTDTRYARGATMAFGRIEKLSRNGGPSVKAKGFCLSEKAQPTVDDTLSTKTMTQGGSTIYYFENLKPGTMYYMRAYATNEDGETSYGDVIKFSTVPKGNITYWYNNGGDATANKRINDALTQACDIFNNLTCISKHFSVGYSAGTPTADCNYKDDPWMNMGANDSYQRTGTIMHEMEHGLGVIPYSTHWSGDILRSGNGTGEWLGDRVSAFLDFWDGKTGSRLKGDTQHMWPYGINGAHEDNGTELLYTAQSLIMQALGEDGLPPTGGFCTPAYVFDQEDTTRYYLRSESPNHGLSTSFLVENRLRNLRSVDMTPAEAAANDSCAWHITFNPATGYYQFRNVATGHYLTYTTTSGSGSFKLVQKDKPASTENIHLMRGRVDAKMEIDDATTLAVRGYWIIHPESSATPPCMTAGTGGAVSTASFSLANSATTQRWVILSEGDMAGIIRTAIDVPTAQSLAPAESTYFDLLGRPVEGRPAKGIYISGGKKVLIR